MDMSAESRSSPLIRPSLGEANASITELQITPTVCVVIPAQLVPSAHHVRSSRQFRYDWPVSSCKDMIGLSSQ
jgi:hypothetical protein